MCFAFSSWTDSLASAMTTLGAKPNHAFFNCQHPSRKKSERRPSNAPRSGREIRRTRLSGGRTRLQPVSARRKRNVAFKVVLSASHCARRGCGPLQVAHEATRWRQRAKDKRIDSETFPGRLFFAPHKPDCADLRELQKAICAIRDASHAHPNGVVDIRADAFHASKPRSIGARRAIGGASNRRSQPQSRSAAYDDPRTARTKKKPPTFPEAASAVAAGVSR